MKKKNDNIKREVLKKIDIGEVKMHSKTYFEVLKALWIVLMTFSIITAIFLINLAFYLPKKAGDFSSFNTHKLISLLSLIPWWLVVFGAFFIGIFIYIYRNYEGGYRKHFSVIIIIISVFVVILGGTIAASNINERMEERPRIKGFYQWNERRFGHPEMRKKHRDRQLPEKDSFHRNF